MNCKYLIFILLVSFIESIRSDEYEDDNRQLEVKLNPGCPENVCPKEQSKKKSDLNIYYVRSSDMRGNLRYGEDMHFVLSTYGGSPAFFIARTENDTEAVFDWDKLKANQYDSIRLVRPKTKTDDKQDSIGVLISRFFKWIDSDDTGIYKPGVSKEEDIDIGSLHWTSAKILDQSKTDLHIEYNLKEPVSGGTITARLMVTSTLKKYVDYPSLLFTSRSVHCQLKINGFTDVLPLNSTTRLGIELTLVSTGQNYELIPYRYIDDEYSPGIFKSLKYEFGKVVKDYSFLTFKPNAYTSTDHSIAQTIDSRQSVIEERKSKSSLAFNNAFNGFYGGDSSRKIWNMTISFGGSGQNFFTKSNYTEFSFVIGLDDLPQPSWSLFIQLVIIVGAGLSILVILVFPISIWLMARKMRKRHESALLNNQDSIY